MVYRVYSEKKQSGKRTESAPAGSFDIEAQSLKTDIETGLRIALDGLRIINRYDAEGLEKELFDSAVTAVFSEPPADSVYFTLPAFAKDETVFAVTALRGQFDQRADSAAQCISIIGGCARPQVKYAKLYVIKGDISAQSLAAIKNYLINKVEAEETSLGELDTLEEPPPQAKGVRNIYRFSKFTDEEIEDFYSARKSLAMDTADLRVCRDYFAQQGRDPTETEIKVLDTYWSDHCRHTTFATVLEDPEIEPRYIRETYEKFLRNNGDKPVCLMRIATAAVRELKAAGELPNLDESEEINACSVKVRIPVKYSDSTIKDEDWLLMFKNETHNHPTEIEPFGGAATCLGGAIRDPLSGRAFVYQAMRISGCGDPLKPLSETLPGKLPAKKIAVTAAAGYSSYGNQIGLATGLVREFYDPGFVAKRMELGAVIGAAPLKNVRREAPSAGDIVILLGGRTGRDGIGGATGSSRAHDGTSLLECGAEVQKGNAVEERKIQRLFRNPAVTKLIKRCNDFGAGGVCVAVGELADGLEIDLDAVPRKYEGLSGTELAVSESQERMAVVIGRGDEGAFMRLAHAENLEATVVATVTDHGEGGSSNDARLVMKWRGQVICDLSREFLNSNGASRSAKAVIPAVTDGDLREYLYKSELANTPEDYEQLACDLNVCGQKGLIQRFDSTVGSGTVLMPLGGKYQQTPAQVMAAKLPVIDGSPAGSSNPNTCDTDAVSVMSFGYELEILKKSPYHGGMLSVVSSVAKNIAGGGRLSDMYLTLQEYFPRASDAKKWGLPMAALLGAYEAQTRLKIAAIGGKDSMSGTYNSTNTGEDSVHACELNVPPTLVSFAVSLSSVAQVCSPEFKKPFSKLYLLTAGEYDENGIPDFDALPALFKAVQELTETGRAISAAAVAGKGGVARAVLEMSLGNRIGAALINTDSFSLFGTPVGSIVIETAGTLPSLNVDGHLPYSTLFIGTTTEEYKITADGASVDIAALEKGYCGKLEPVFKTKTPAHEAPPVGMGRAPAVSAEKRDIPQKCRVNLLAGRRPRVLIPVFPGTNGEYDMAAAFGAAGAETEFFVVRNLTAYDVTESLAEFAKRAAQSQIIALAGGFSAGDEPEGSGKFITAFFSSEKARKAVSDLLDARDGLIIGICNGFQALVKLGLLPHGKITALTDKSPTLTFNSLGRHNSQLVNTRVSSVNSPWLLDSSVGDVYLTPVSHGEGRFTAPRAVLAELVKNGQVFSQYADEAGVPTMDGAYNPNGSDLAIEGIISRDGRILGKMGHIERVSSGVFKNVQSKYSADCPIIASGVKYFS